MAKQRTRLKDFFEGKRRECRLNDFHVLKDRADMLRMKMAVTMPLSNLPAVGMSEHFAETFLLMDKQKSTLNHSKVNVEVQGAAVAMFTTDSVKGAAVKGAAGSLQNFRLVAEGVDDKRQVDLEFDLYLPVTDAEDDPLANWAMKHLHKDFYVEVVPSQMELKESDPQDPKPNKKKKPEQSGLLM